MWASKDEPLPRHLVLLPQAAVAYLGNVVGVVGLTVLFAHDDPRGLLRGKSQTMTILRYDRFPTCRRRERVSG